MGAYHCIWYDAIKKANGFRNDQTRSIGVRIPCFSTGMFAAKRKYLTTGSVFGHADFYSSQRYLSNRCSRRRQSRWIRSSCHNHSRASATRQRRPHTAWEDDGGNDRDYAPVEGDHVDIARGSIERLEAENVDAIIGLTHVHLWTDKEIAKLKANHPRFPFIAGGHEHELEHEPATGEAAPARAISRKSRASASGSTAAARMATGSSSYRYPPKAVGVRSIQTNPMWSLPRISCSGAGMVTTFPKHVMYLGPDQNSNTLS